MPGPPENTYSGGGRSFFRTVLGGLPQKQCPKYRHPINIDPVLFDAGYLANTQIGLFADKDGNRNLDFIDARINIQHFQFMFKAAPFSGYAHSRAALLKNNFPIPGNTAAVGRIVPHIMLPPAESGGFFRAYLP